MIDLHDSLGMLQNTLKCLYMKNKLKFLWIFLDVVVGSGSGSVTQSNLFMSCIKHNFDGNVEVDLIQKRKLFQLRCLSFTSENW